MEHRKTGANHKLPFNLATDYPTRPPFRIPAATSNANRFKEFRASLPIFAHREEIIETIESNQVVIISGETGSGKTTQVPQYIMEHYALHKKVCRIICTQPRRIAATSIADRVSQEREDRLGNSVGYQIRLESRVKADTNLIFTTSGFLLRCLTSSKPDEVFNSVTHLFLDEVHEREKITDFLLIAIRDGLRINPNLKIILMSATLDSQIFSQYFNDAPTINVPGKMFPVDVAYLGEIISMTGYKTKSMEKYMHENKGPKVLRAARANGGGREAGPDKSSRKENAVEAGTSGAVPCDDVDFFDDCLELCASADVDAPFDQIYYLITEENMPVDYVHSQSGRSALSIAAEKGFYHVLTTLLSFGANPAVGGADGVSAFAYARRFKHDDCAQLLLPYEKSGDAFNGPPKASDEPPERGRDEHTEALEQFRLAAYLLTNSGTNDIDHDLLFHIVRHVHTNFDLDGSVLVFLPGYDDIMKQKEYIETNLNGNDYQLFLLHSGLDSDQKTVFQKLHNQRKIILSTNIAETSVTIDDVEYVIDSGKVKQQTYDSVSNTTCLTSTWISQACAKQRAGRAGRTREGHCFRMYSLEHFESMEKYTLPEILRVPLTDICLNAKILCDETSIEDFLLKALQPPSITNIRQSINLLKKMDALDANEDITYLGLHLAALPVDVQLGKCIMFAILFRCLNPLITIVSTLSVKDPFYLPVGDEGPKIYEAKKSFANRFLSDHVMLERTYEEWNKWRNTRGVYQFCRENYLSYGSMQMIYGIRKLIIGQLGSLGISNTHSLNENSENSSVIKACLTAGLYPNVCRIDHAKGKIYSKYDRKLLPHLSSILRDRKSKNQMDPQLMEANCDYLIHGEKSKVSHYSLIRNISAVPSICIALFGGPIKLPETNVWTLEIDEWAAPAPMGYFSVDESTANTEQRDADSDDERNGKSQESTFRVDDWIGFTMAKEEAELLLKLRQKMCAVLSRFFRNPRYSVSDADYQVLSAVTRVIDGETRLQMGDVQGLSEAEQERRARTRPGAPKSGWAFSSPSYSNALAPEFRRNRNRPDTNRRKLILSGPPTNWRNRPTPLQPTTSSEAASRGRNPDIWAPRTLPMQNDVPPEPKGPKKKSILLRPSTIPRHGAVPTNYYPLPPSANADAQSGSFYQPIEAPNPFPPAALPAPPFIFHVLVIDNLLQLHNMFRLKQWQFRKPLNEMRKIERQNRGTSIIVFYYVRSESAIFGAGQFFGTRDKPRYALVAQQLGGFKLIK